MTYLMFDETREYETEDGEPCTLADHLEYLRTWGGTPDMMETFLTLNEAKAAAYRENRTVLIVSDTADYRPVHRSTFEPRSVTF